VSPDGWLLSRCGSFPGWESQDQLGERGQAVTQGDTNLPGSLLPHSFGALSCSWCVAFGVCPIPPVDLTQQAEEYLRARLWVAFLLSLFTSQARVDSQGGVCTLNVQDRSRKWILQERHRSVCLAFFSFDLKDVFETSDFGGVFLRSRILCFRHASS